MTHSMFGILFVCTGNICRSPVAEIVTRRLLTERLGASAKTFIVASAGTAAVTGAPMATGSRAALDALDATHAAGSFRARRLSADMVAAADLVLTAERDHRRLVALLRPEARARTFCFLEFVRLLAGVEWCDPSADPVARARAAVVTARARRGMTGLVRAEADAVPDPLTHTPGVHRRTVELVTAASHQLVKLLAPHPRRTETASPVEGVMA
jgi:protein-tyrosine phosphatase